MAEDRPKPETRGPDPHEREGNATALSRRDLSEWMEDVSRNVNRRDFLKAAGFTLAGAAAFGGCSRSPIRNAFPHVVQPEGIVPGRAIHYASVCGACEAGCGTLVKSRDGRPIKNEGNPDHAVSRGGLCAMGQASLLGLYDSHRFKDPQIEGNDATWKEVDEALMARLEDLRGSGVRVRFLTGTLISPTARDVIRRFLDTFKDARHIVYDPLSCSAILDAHEKTHGARVLPRYDFAKAEVIAGFDADFLGTWIDPVGFTQGYQAGRVLEGESVHLSRHVQFESRMSLTGSNADTRFRIAPEELGHIMSHLAVALAEKAQVSIDASRLEASSLPQHAIHELAEELWEKKGLSLVVCGSQDITHQILCNFINHLLGNYEETLSIAKPSYQKQGSDGAMAELLEELKRGEVDALFIAGLNPAYELPGGALFAEELDQTELVVNFALRPDETTAHSTFICPDHHFLESWGDAEPVHGLISLSQPLIRPLRNSRAFIDSLNAWSGAPERAYDTLRRRWEAEVFDLSSETPSFQTFWNKTLHDGFTPLASEPVQTTDFDRDAVRLVPKADPVDEAAFSLVLYPKVALREGRHGYNPWLHELPDPMTKVTWGNYASLSVDAAVALKVAEGQVVRIEAGGESGVLELPVHIQPGQHDRVVAVALGYGQETSRRFSNVGPSWILAKPTVGKDGLVGKNAAPFQHFEDGTIRFERSGVKLIKTRKKSPLALTQIYHSVSVPERLAPAGGLVRPLIQETTLAEYEEDPSSGSLHLHEFEGELYPDDHPYNGRHWGMAIDLSACTGCSACVIACQVENNVPVVGKDEVRRRRDMHWIRIDRYYSGEADEVDVVHQPMMCHHCDNAPCENVCPVLATVHTEEGLNAQVYNRCVGTRYCANNCPYKVRRFNWFNYHRDTDPLENMVLNPDVTVRDRGVMEKCSFCVQRLQEAKIEAKRKGEPVTDDAVQPACQQSCPAQAIVMGDMNDPESQIAKAMKSPRHYTLLADLNVRPSVGYLTLVRNREAAHAGQEGSGHDV